MSVCRLHIEKFYANTRFNIEIDLWQLLHPEHFVNVLLINHIGSSTEKEILDIATIMRHGFPFNKILIEDLNVLGSLKYFSICIESEETPTETNEIVDIFQSFKNNDGSTMIPKFILIEGAPGMGKTTLCKEIAYRWAKGRFLEDTNLLFLVYLRDPDIVKIKNLKDLVHYFYNFDEGATELSKQCAKILNYGDNNDVTIILDGYDEFDCSSNSLITGILGRKILPQCRIVVTSRLTTSEKLRKKADVKVQVLGFSDESKIQFIKQGLKDHPDKINKLLSYLHDHETINSICYMPMIMTILVYVYKEKGQLPNNSTELYEKFVALTISHHLQKQNKSDDIYVSLQILPKKCKSFLFSLSQFAFLLFKTRQTVFSKEDINILCPDLTLASSDLDSLGLINSVQYFCTDKGKVRVFNFLHLSIQEYLAGYYISSIDQCGQFEELENTFLNKMYHGTWNMFISMHKKAWLRFKNYYAYCEDAYCKTLMKWKTNVKSLSFSESFISLYDTVSTDSVSSNVQILFSKYDKNAASDYQEHIYLAFCNIRKLHLGKLELFIVDKVTKGSNSYWYMLLQKLWLTKKFSIVFYEDHFLALNKVNQEQIVDAFKCITSLTRITLEDCHISKTTVDTINLSCLQHLLQFHVISCSFEQSALIKLLKFLGSISTLLSIAFKNNNFSTEQLDALSTLILKNRDLQILELSNNNLDNNIAKVAEALKHIRTLEMLNLCNNNLSGGALIVAKALKHIKSLKLLNLSNSNISENAYGEIAEAIKLNKHLEKLWLLNNNLKSSAIVILHSLSTIKTLKVLHMDNNQIGKNSGRALASVIRSNIRLKELHFAGNNLQNSGIEVLAALQKVSNLEILDLSNNNLVEGVGTHLAAAIKSNTSLTQLWLHNNDLQSSAVVILQALSKLSTLVLLDLHNCNLTSIAAEGLENVVLNNTRLKFLYLNDNSLGKGLIIILKALRSISSLKEFYFNNNNFMNNVIADLRVENKLRLFLENFYYRYSDYLDSVEMAIVEQLRNASKSNIWITTTEEAEAALASTLQNNPTLEAFDIDSDCLCKTPKQLTQALKHVTSIKVLNFDNLYMSREMGNDLASAINLYTCLESVCLCNNNLELSAMILVIQALSTISTLKVLYIQSNGLTEITSDSLTSLIINNPLLQSLFLDHNNIGVGAIKIAKALQSNKSLRMLGLNNNNLSNENVHELMIELTSAIKSNCYLELLTLSFNDLQSSATFILQHLSTTISTLKVLYMDYNNIGEKGGEALASVLKSNPKLTKLQFGGNDFRKSSIMISEALQSISSLESLDLSNNSLPEEVGIELAAAIQSNRTLKHLLLHSNNLQSSVDSILQALSKLSTLELLDLHNSNLTSIAVKGLENVIVNNVGLQYLYLNDNNLGKGLINIFKVLQSISSLKELNISNNNFMNDVTADLTVANKLRVFLEFMFQRSNYQDYMEIVFLKQLYNASKSVTIVTLVEEGDRALASFLQNNPRLEMLHPDITYLNISKQFFKSLQHTKTIEVLNFNNCSLCREMVSDLASTVKLHTCLKEIYLCNSNLKSSAIILLEALSRISTLKVLDLQSNGLTEEAGDPIQSVIINNSLLERLILDNNSIGMGVLKIAKALQNINSLKVLSLKNNNLCKEISDELAMAIKSNYYLESLTLSSNNLLSSVIVLESLSNISTLKVLNMNNNQIGEKGGEALASVIKINTRLQALYCSNNNLKSSVAVVSEALQNISTIELLDLSNNDLPEGFGTELAATIQSNRLLKYLSLRSNNLSSSDVILQAISKISRLEELDLRGNQLSKTSGEWLRSMIVSNSELKALYLGNNNIGVGILKIAKAIRNLKSLKMIDLSTNNLSKETLTIFLQSLSTISTLEVLNLDNNQIGVKGGEVLALVIKSNTKLKELHLRNGNLQRSVMKISQTLKSLPTLEALNLANNNLPGVKDIELLSTIQSNSSRHVNNIESSILAIAKALDYVFKLKCLDLFGNTITEEAGNALAVVISKNIKLQFLSFNLLASPLKVTEALQSLSSLQTLIFDTCNISKEDEKRLASAVANNKSLTWLSLENNSLSKHIIQSIKTISNLTSLLLGDSLLSKEMSDDLSLVVARNKSLEELKLVNNMLQSGLIKIAKACNKLTNIQVLQLAHNCIIPSKLVELVSVIAQNTSLKTILLGGVTLNAAESFHLNISEIAHKADLTNCYNTNHIIPSNVCVFLEIIYLEMLRKQISNDTKCFDNAPVHMNAKNFNFAQRLQCYFEENDITQLKTHDANQKLAQIDAKKMISSLHILEKVKIIDLENSNIDEDASFALTTALHSNKVLEQLWLRGNTLNTTGALYILNLLEDLKTLRVLDLSYSNISSETADGIAAVIDNNPLISQLWLDGNDLHSTGTITICSALKNIKTLSILSLCNNGITDDAANELSAVITQNVLLDDLLLSNNQLHSRGIEIISRSLSKLIKLRKLDLFNNNIGKEGASSLAIVIHNSPTLQDLALSGNNLEASGALEICNALSHINSLHVLTLSNNNISDEVTSQLIEVLNNNHLYALLIGGNGLECGGLKIAQVIKNGNIAIQLLDVSNNNISEQDKEEIKVAFMKRANFQLYI